uniref:Uncharacterized protein n=1 Tax=Rhizophagus irregularis (strain DAOM 181602 / DAOM 197198 / MUCL 43194) TaxID=747089 RepID=U9TYR6_RHIID
MCCASNADLRQMSCRTSDVYRRLTVDAASVNNWQLKYLNELQGFFKEFTKLWILKDSTQIERILIDTNAKYFTDE